MVVVVVKNCAILQIQLSFHYAKAKFFFDKYHLTFVYICSFIFVQRVTFF